MVLMYECAVSFSFPVCSQSPMYSGAFMYVCKSGTFGPCLSFLLFSRGRVGFFDFGVVPYFRCVLNFW